MGYIILGIITLVCFKGWRKYENHLIEYSIVAQYQQLKSAINPPRWEDSLFKMMSNKNKTNAIK